MKQENLNQPKKPFFKRFWWMGTIGTVVLLIIIVAGFQLYRQYIESSGVFTKKCTTEAGPDPVTGGITWTLPDCASMLRLSLPATIDEIFYSPDTGPDGFGASAGEHIEGLDHIGIRLKKGTPIRSLADGKVTHIQEMEGNESREYQVYIDYGYNLAGSHAELSAVNVRKGQRVKQGEIIGVGFESEEDSGQSYTALEYALFDGGREDGVLLEKRKGSAVSPYDYLNDSDKKVLVQAYQENYLEPYLAGQRDRVSLMFTPYQPYLTNKLFTHQGNEGKIIGQWYSSRRWGPDNPPDFLTFIEANTPYFKGNLVLSGNEGEGPYPELNGTYEIDYVTNRIKITAGLPDFGLQDFKKKLVKDSDKDFIPIPMFYYGIFKIDESGDRPKLTIQYQQGSYPNAFDATALEYVLRSNRQRRPDGYSLGVRDSGQ